MLAIYVMLLVQTKSPLVTPNDLHAIINEELAFIVAQANLDLQNDLIFFSNLVLFFLYLKTLILRF